MSSSSSSSSSLDSSSSDESALPTPTDSYGRSSKYCSTHSQLRAALASDPHRKIRPLIFAHGSTSSSTSSSEDEFVACTAPRPQKQVTSRPKPVARRRAVSKFAIIAHPPVILPSSPTTSILSISRSDSDSSSSSDLATPTEEKPRVFLNSLHNPRIRKQPITFAALRPPPLDLDVASPLIFGIATPPAFITPKSTPRVDRGEWTSEGTAGLQIFQVLARVNEKLDVEATLRMKLEEAGKGMNREVWERRMARRGRKAL